MPKPSSSTRERAGEVPVEPVLDRVHTRQRGRVVAAQVRQDQRIGERQAVRGEGRDDVQRDDDGVGAHGHRVSPGRPLENSPDFSARARCRTRHAARRARPRRLRARARAGGDRQDRAAGRGPRARHRARLQRDRQRPRAIVPLRCRPAAVRRRARRAHPSRPARAVLGPRRPLPGRAAGRRRALGRPRLAALARVHGQPGRRPAAGDRARGPRRRAGRAAGPDRAALGHDRARAAPAVGSRGGGAGRRRRACSRPPAATRSTSTR